MPRYVVAWAMLAATVPAGCRAPRPQENAWELVVEETFSSPDALKRWVVDGTADVSVTADGELLVETQQKEVEGKRARCSTLWYATPVWGDVRIELDARGEPKNRCILFFNAQPRQGHKSPFEWQRPRADYADYAADARLHLYTLGILRYDQDTINLRYLGGLDGIEILRKMEAAPRKSPERRRLYDLFQQKTVLRAAPCPFADPVATYHIEARVVGARLTVRADGREVLDLVDEPRRATPLRGGYIALRNFTPTRAWYDNLRVYRRKGRER